MSGVHETSRVIPASDEWASAWETDCESYGRGMHEVQAENRGHTTSGVSIEIERERSREREREREREIDKERERERLSAACVTVRGTHRESRTLAAFAN